MLMNNSKFDEKKSKLNFHKKLLTLGRSGQTQPYAKQDPEQKKLARRSRERINIITSN